MNIHLLSELNKQSGFYSAICADVKVDHQRGLCALRDESPQDFAVAYKLGNTLFFDSPDLGFSLCYVL